MAEFGDVITLFLSVVATVTSVYALISQWRKNKSEAKRTDADAEKIRNEITTAVLATAQADMLRRDMRIEELEKNVVAITAKLVAETSLYVAVQKALDLATARISALEAELLKRDKRILELEMLTNWVRNGTENPNR